MDGGGRRKGTVGRRGSRSVPRLGPGDVTYGREVSMSVTRGCVRVSVYVCESVSVRLKMCV